MFAHHKVGVLAEEVVALEISLAADAVLVDLENKVEKIKWI